MENEQNVQISIEDIRKLQNEQSFLGKFILKDHDDKDQPIPFVCTVYSNKYPGFYYESIYNHFIRFSNKLKSCIWLSYNDQPIQWHLPFFVAIDKLNQEVEIIVHFKKRPDNVLSISDNFQVDIKNRYYWNLKQACMIRYAHRWEKQIFQTLTIEQQYNMFQSYSDHNFKPQFYDFFDKIWEQNILKKETILNIPLRIFYQDIMIQRPYACKDLNDNLQNLLSTIFENSLDYENIQLSLQGIKVNLNFSIRILINTFVNPDGFCYIVIK